MRIGSILLRLGLGLALVLWLLRRLDPASVMAQLAGMSSGEIAALFVPAVVMLGAASLNVGILLRALGSRPPWSVTLWIVHLSRSFGSVLPGRVGDLSLPP
ncbi:MAG: lysylphosphatidylglycerol synthase domain-containing protein, partial [Phycisphaerales bacterium]|nr:lysylphosphatidylglycerol synthase domain-containing protein [Phycisphaerales bacterium]